GAFVRGKARLRHDAAGKAASHTEAAAKARAAGRAEAAERAKAGRPAQSTQRTAEGTGRPSGRTEAARTRTEGARHRTAAARHATFRQRFAGDQHVRNIRHGFRITVLQAIDFEGHLSVVALGRNASGFRAGALADGWDADASRGPGAFARP